jgi:hypothetical protein
MSETGGDKNPVAEFELHLIRAGREFLAATKSLIEGLDAALEALEHRVETQAAPAPKIEAIPIRRNAQ